MPADIGGKPGSPEFLDFVAKADYSPALTGLMCAGVVYVVIAVVIKIVGKK